MRVVIAGCGRVGRDLALSMADDGHDVSVIDSKPEVFRLLGSTFNGTVHEGIAYDIRVLREAGIEFADAFVAVTNGDNANLMAVQVATQVFGVPKTIARLDDPRRTDAYRALNVQHVAGAKLTSRAIHEQLLDEEFRYHVSFFGDEVELIEMRIGDGGDGLAIGQLEIAGKLRVAAIRRGMVTHVADPDFVLEEDDVVVAAARAGVRRKVRRYCKQADGK